MKPVDPARKPARKDTPVTSVSRYPALPKNPAPRIDSFRKKTKRLPAKSTSRKWQTA